MNTLSDRRQIARISFIHSILSGQISSPSLLLELRLKIPNRITRGTANSLLYTNDLKDPINVMCKSYNEIFHLVDFNQSVDTVKNNLKSYFKRTLN